MPVASIALDDFGYGLSSLAHLKRLPVQYLKIDGRFVRRVLEDRVAESIVSGIARASRTLGVRRLPSTSRARRSLPGFVISTSILGRDFFSADPQSFAKPLDSEPRAALASRLLDLRPCVAALASSHFFPKPRAYNSGTFCKVRGPDDGRTLPVGCRRARVRGACAAAETAYVTDSLRLGLHHAEDTSDSPFQNLVSGAALEVLERTPSYAHVRTAEGQEGWVKSAYLVAQEAGRCTRGRARGRARSASPGSGSGAYARSCRLNRKPIVSVSRWPQRADSTAANQALVSELKARTRRTKRGSRAIAAVCRCPGSAPHCSSSRSAGS